MKSVPPGTNGAITPQGIVASMVGGLSMGGVFALDLYLENGSACSGRTVSPIWELCTFGLIVGAAGSMVSPIRFRYDLTDATFLF